MLLVGLPFVLLVGPFVVAGPWGILQIALAWLSPTLVALLVTAASARKRKGG
jgi:hypothetical protein